MIDVILTIWSVASTFGGAYLFYLQGKDNGYREGYENGKKIGGDIEYSNGYNKGYKTGEQKGYLDAKFEFCKKD